MNISILDFRFWILDYLRLRPLGLGWAGAFGKTSKSGSAFSFNPKSKIQNPKSLLAFSLVEVLAAVALIGIITFLALPNIVRIKTDSEESLAISRAEAINLSMASYLQAHGQIDAATGWAGATSANARYALLAPYLAYAPSAFADYMPGGYSITLPTALLPLSKVPLTGPSGSITY